MSIHVKIIRHIKPESMQVNAGAWLVQLVFSTNIMLYIVLRIISL